MPYKTVTYVKQITFKNTIKYLSLTVYFKCGRSACINGLDYLFFCPKCDFKVDFKDPPH